LDFELLEQTEFDGERDVVLLQLFVKLSVVQEQVLDSDVSLKKLEVELFFLEVVGVFLQHACDRFV
jgi:hypothetical protein